MPPRKSKPQEEVGANLDYKVLNEAEICIYHNGYAYYLLHITQLLEPAVLLA